MWECGNVGIHSPAGQAADLPPTQILHGFGIHGGFPGGVGGAPEEQSTCKGTRQVMDLRIPKSWESHLSGNRYWNSQVSGISPVRTWIPRILKSQDLGIPACLSDSCPSIPKS